MAHSTDQNKSTPRLSNENAIKRRAQAITKTDMAKFRFQDMKIWQLAIQIVDELFDLAEMLDEKILYRFADQIRGAGMSNVK